jgi:putative membrane protein
MSAGAGCAALAAALAPPFMDTMDFRIHVVGHLMLAMLAPLALALSAPTTLAMRTLPRRTRAVLLAVVHSGFVRMSLLPPVLLVLDVGGMYVYYLTPLFAAAEHHPWLHAIVHAHMFLAGCLLSWYVVGRDPLPRRRSTRAAVAVLFVAAGSHDLLAKLMYAHLLPVGGGTATQVQEGAQIMFYGGDVIEVLLALALLTNWYARTGRAVRHQQRRGSEPVQPVRTA